MSRNPRGGLKKMFDRKFSLGEMEKFGGKLDYIEINKLRNIKKKSKENLRKIFEKLENKKILNKMDFKTIIAETERKMD